MPKGDKYIELTEYLKRCGKESLKLSFLEINSIIGCELPDSAYKHQAWWSNSESHSSAFGWMNAGYITSNVDIANGQVEFIKSGQQPYSMEKNKPKQKVCTSSLSVVDAIQAIEEYMNEIAVDPHVRFMSWVHCYNVFTKLRGQRDE